MRTVLFAALAVASLSLLSPTPAAASGAPGRLEFQVFRNGNLEGRHSIEARREGADLKVDVRILLAGRVGPFSYRYDHACAERWRDGALQSLDCVDTERDGDQKRLTARRGPDGRIALRSPRASNVAPGDALPSSWWNVDLVTQDRMIDTRNGVLIPIRVQRIGVETVETPAGPVQATRYRIRGTAAADAWYDAEGRWVKMAFRLRGQRFEYRLATAPAEAPRG